MVPDLIIPRELCAERTAGTMNFILMVEVEDDAIGSFLYRETFHPGVRLKKKQQPGVSG